MASVFVNGESHQGKWASLGELLREIRQKAWKEGKIVVRVALDDEPVAVRRDTDYDGMFLRDHKTIKIETENLQIALLKRLASLPQLLIETQEKLKDAAGKYRLGREPEGHRLLVEGVELMQGLQVQLRALEIFIGFQISHGVVKGRDGKELLSELTSGLAQLQEKIEQDDPLDLADLLEYELVAILERFKELVCGWGKLWPELIKENR